MLFTPYIPTTFQAQLNLPGSKSLSNRALLLCALSGEHSQVTHLSNCSDTHIMQEALSTVSEIVNLGAAGTAMRFMTAYFAATPQSSHIVTGTERMKQRPIGILVDALRSLGADITYLENNGFPPLRINGRRLHGGSLTLSAGVSSQFISALLMIAPLTHEGLTLELEGNIISRPYIDMTLSLMQHFGASACWINDTTLEVQPGGYVDGTTYAVESDWSAASYWYELMAFAKDQEARLVLTGLQSNSLQGDCAVQHFYESLGVQTTYDETLPGIILTRKPTSTQPTNGIFTLDLSATPDLAQALIVTCALLRRPFRFTGLQSLRIKETDRIVALQNELRKFGIELHTEGADTLTITTYAEAVPYLPTEPIATYKDHRMAMSFAPAALLFPSLTIESPEVVQKSYPDYWKNLYLLIQS